MGDRLLFFFFFFFFAFILYEANRYGHLNSKVTPYFFQHNAQKFYDRKIQKERKRKIPLTFVPGKPGKPGSP